MLLALHVLGSSDELDGGLITEEVKARAIVDKECPNPY
jgi:hypothetical protein